MKDPSQGLNIDTRPVIQIDPRGLKTDLKPLIKIEPMALKIVDPRPLIIINSNQSQGP
jgi:hypothetical protein